MPSIKVMIYSPLRASHVRTELFELTVVPALAVLCDLPAIITIPGLRVSRVPQPLALPSTVSSARTSLDADPLLCTSRKDLDFVFLQILWVQRAKSLLGSC